MNDTDKCKARAAINSVILSVVALTVSSGVAVACCRNYEEFAEACRAQGGVPSKNPPTCSEASSSAPSVPRGPSAEEIRKQREAKDLNEAAEDANDKGAESYQRGDWANAARYFREALEYDPENPDIRSNLNHAQRKLELARLAEAARQLKSAEDHARQAAQPQASEASSEEARRRFDTGGKDAGTLDVSAVKAGTLSQKEPVVPPARRTPAITALETQRSESRKQAGVLEEKMKQLDPSKNAVELAKAKQEKSTIESKIQYLNLSISELLEAPAENSPAAAEKQKH